MKYFLIFTILTTACGTESAEKASTAPDAIETPFADEYDVVCQSSLASNKAAATSAGLSTKDVTATEVTQAFQGEGVTVTMCKTLQDGSTSSISIRKSNFSVNPSTCLVSYDGKGLLQALTEMEYSECK